MATPHVLSFGPEDLNLEAAGLVLQEHAVLRKYEGDEQTPEHLLEVIVMDDGVVTDRWYRGEDRDAPE
jgi:hypothetical protein